MWAEWFAIVSGGIYVPIEIFEIVKRVTVLRVIVLAVNAFIVIYLIYIRWAEVVRPMAGRLSRMKGLYFLGVDVNSQCHQRYCFTPL